MYVMRNGKKIYSATFSLLLLFELVFLYYIKYSNQDLPLSEFSLKNTGNIINLAVTIVLILGILIYMNRKESKIKLLISMMVLSLLALFIAFFSTINDFSAENVHYSNQPANKLIDAGTLTFYYFIMFTFLSVVWSMIFGSGKMILLRSILNSIFIIFIYLGIACIFIQGSRFNSKGWELTKNPNNVAVVLGAAVWSGNQPSPSLSGRIDRAVELFNNGMAGEIILTGGNAPGEMSEAEVAYEYAKRKGMKMSKVKTESLTTSTTEQMKYIKNKLADFEDINDIIVVSDAYHLVRVLEISKFFNIKILVAASRMELKDENKFYRQLRECIALMVFWSFAL